MKILVILRGLPGCGKSTFAKRMWPDCSIFEADKFFYNENGEYVFDSKKLGDAHSWCKSQVESAMSDENFVGEIVVSNTNTTEKELEPYIKLAEKYGFMIVSLVVENRHGNSNVHNVPQETLQKMKDRFHLKLI